MKYMLLIHGNDATPPAPGEMEKILAGHKKLVEDLQAGNKMVHGERLRPEGDAARVRLKGGQRQVTDGPFAETKEALGGFYLIQAASKQEAVEWAHRIPLREGGYVEVRPVWEM